MHLRGSLALSHLVVSLVVLGIVALVAEGRIGFPEWMGGGLLALLLGLVAARLLLGPLERLASRIRHLGKAESDELVWSQPIVFPALPDLEVVLEGLRERLRQRLAELAAKESHLEGILDSIDEGVMVIGRDGRVAMANQALTRRFGIKPPFQGRLPVEVVRHKEIQTAIAQSLAQGEAASLEIALSGEGECYLDVHVTPICKEGENLGVVTLFYDITPLRQLERARKDFIANLSHELRTPLTAIKGYAETLSDGALDDRQTAEHFLQVILAHADRLNRLLDDILDLSRLEAENLEVEFQRCRLRPLVETSIAAVAQTAASKNLALSLEIPADLEVYGDARLIEQVLTNLLDNAVKYTPEGGKIEVRSRPFEGDEDRVVVEVADTGIGIPSKDQERIFERFYRVDKGRSRALGGTGLGLSIVRHILQAHGERVWVASELGRGSTFSFSLRRC